MADLIELDVVVRDKTIKQSISTVSRLERELTKAAKAIEENRISQDRYNKILLSAKREYQALGLSSQKATASVRKFANEQRRLATTTDTVQKEVQQTTTAINNHVKSVNSAAAAMNRQTQAAQKGSKGLKQFASIGLQQVGYQVSDFMVQVQGGTNALVAFGQQGSQLAGLLFFLPGLFGAIAGSVVSIAIPAFTAFGNVLFNLGDGSKAVQNSVDALSESLETYRSSAEKATQSSSDLAEMYGESADKARELFEINKTLAELDAIDALKNSMITLRDQFGDFSSVSTSALQDAMDTFDELGGKINQAASLSDEEFGRANRALQVYGDTVFDLERKLGSTTEQAFQFAIELSKLSQAEGPREAAEQLDAVRSLYFDIIGGTEGATDAQREMLRQLVNTAIEAMNLKVEIDSTAVSTSSAANEAQRLAGALASASSIASGLLARVGGVVQGLRDQVAAVEQGTSVSIVAMERQLRDLEETRARLDAKGMDVSNTVKQIEAIRSGIEDAKKETINLEKAQEAVAAASKKSGSAGSKANKEIEDTAKKSKTALEEAYITSEEFAELWKNQVVDGIESVSGAFTDFIMSGFRNFEDFADAIKATFRNLIATLIQTAVQNQIVIPIVASVTGGGGGIAGALTGGGGGGGGLLGNLPGGGGGLLGTIGGGIATLGSNLVTGGSAVAGGFLQGFGGVVGQGFGGLGASFGSLGNLVTGGVAAGGGSIASAIGAALPAVGVIAAGIGLISKAFEKQTESWEVIVGNISKLDAKIEKFGMIKSYNMFSSDVDYYSAPVEEGVFASFLQGVRQVQQGAMDAAATLGISADAFNNFVFQIDPYAESLTDEIVRMGDAFAALVPGVSNLNELLAVANERYNLNTRLLQLQGNEEELLRRQREQELAAVHPLNRATLERIHALEDELRQQQQLEQILQERDQLAQRNLQDAERAVRDAFNALRESIRRVVDDLRVKLRAANDTLQNSQRLFDLLSGYSSSRRIEGAQLSEPLFEKARSSALGFLRTGNISDKQRLEEALQIVSEPSEQLFGSFVDYARDFYRTSNVIKDLERDASKQLNADEQAVQKLEYQILQTEAQLGLMQEQWNTLRGIKDGILTLPEAINNLAAALGDYETAQEATAPAPNTSSYSEDTYSGFDREQRYLANNLDVLRAIQRGEFASATEHYLLHGQYEGRAFAQGGFHTGGVRMVGEQGPELEMTGPSRIFSHRQTADMFRDPELTNEVRSLRSEVAGLRTENAQLLANNNKYTKRSYDLYRKWDVDGQPPERT